MVNYSNSKIYKLVNSNYSEGNCYYGSTTNSLHKRFYQHKKKYKYWKARKKGYISSYKLFQEDFENVKIILVEEVKCENKQQLLARERYYVENYKCLNRKIPGRTYKEYIKTNEYKEYQQKYRKANAYKIKEYMKEYNKTNKKKILKRNKENYETNKKKIAKQQKEYRIKNKKAIEQKRKEKIKCEFCGCFTRKSNLRRHQKTIKCKSFQNNI